MNLKQVQTRIGELSAELLTLHNNLAFLLEGEAGRQAVGTIQITHWSQLKSGDTINIPKNFFDCANGLRSAGEFFVEEVEPEDYEGSYQVCLRNKASTRNGIFWLNFDPLVGVTKVVK